MLLLVLSLAASKEQEVFECTPRQAAEDMALVAQGDDYAMNRMGVCLLNQGR